MLVGKIESSKHASIYEDDGVLVQVVNKEPVLTACRALVSIYPDKADTGIIFYRGKTPVLTIKNIKAAAKLTLDENSMKLVRI